MSLCHTEHFSVWNSTSNTFTNCFEDLVLDAGSHALLGIFSVLYYFVHRPRQLIDDVPHSVTLNIRFLAGLIITLLTISFFFLTYYFAKLDLDTSQLLSGVVQLCAWILHSFYVWKLKRFQHVHIRGPLLLVFSFLASCVALAVHTRAIIIGIERSHMVNAVDEYISYIKCICYLAYLITLLPNKRPPVEPSFAPNGEVVGSLSEASPLLPVRRRSIVSLGKAGNNAGVFSRVLFLWVNPLLRKGFNGDIERVDDTYDLPEYLDTNSIDDKFKGALSHETETPSRASAADLMSQSITSLASNASADVETREATNDGHPLLRALHKSFGCECYSIGILKFISDSLDFAGPILLNLIVSYMENTKEATWHGYVYAACLFTATLLSALCSTHFNYRITVIGLKVRAALVTSVYRKALKVNHVSLSTFSTGEVVNFMSTDTDRLVNFTQGMHQIWSLPLQIGVALFLLHRQVGVSFLSGIAFALILIPINK